MAGEWKQVEIEHLIRDGILLINDGYRAKNAELSNHGLPFARAGNVDGGFHFEDADRVPPETLSRVGMKRSKTGDVVFTSKGTVGRFAFVRDDTPEFVYSPQLCFWRSGDTELIHPRWLYYWMNGREFYLQFKGVASQTDMAEYVSLRDQRAMKITLPPVAEQRAIAAVLGALDDKIELNRRMNATLEAMARALFKSWFVDFDPVRAKLDGREPAGMDAETAALFPEHLEDSPLGHIPRGWKVKTIESLCDVITSGGTPARMHKAYWEPATVPWFKTGELLDGPLIGAEERISEEGLASSSCKLWPAGTILFALYASPTVGRFGVLTKPGTSNQAAAALIAKPAYGVPFLMGLLYEARAELQRVAVGAAQQNINQGVLKSHVVVTPPPALAKAYSVEVASWFEQRIRLAEHSRTLAALRDTLLPKLLSGEVSTRELNSTAP